MEGSGSGGSGAARWPPAAAAAAAGLATAPPLPALPACIALSLIHHPVSHTGTLPAAAIQWAVYHTPLPTAAVRPLSHPVRPPSLTPPRHSPPLLQAPCLPKGMVRTFKIINIPDQEAAPAPSTSGNGRAQNQTGPLLSARLCDLDVVWQRASQLCEVSVQVRPGRLCSAVQAHEGSVSSAGCCVWWDVMLVCLCAGCRMLGWFAEASSHRSPAGPAAPSCSSLPLLPAPSSSCPPFATLQHKENLRVVVEGANNGGLLSKINGLSLFVPVSQLEKKGDKEWWTEQVRGWAPCSPVWLPFYLPGCPGTPL